MLTVDCGLWGLWGRCGLCVWMVACVGCELCEFCGFRKLNRSIRFQVAQHLWGVQSKILWLSLIFLFILCFGVKQINLFVY